MSFKGEEEKTSANVYFPESFSVLVVDGDSLSLDEITKMCEQCSYKVTATTKAIEALSILREARSRFDIVISDINMHDMDPFEFIKIVSVDTDLPLVLVSIDDDNDTVVKAINNGACDYLLKPIQINNIKFIWKHVVRSQKWKMEQSKTEPNIEDCQIPLNLSNSDIFNVIESRNVISESSSSSIVAKDDEDIRKKEIAQKKLRYVWTPQLHDKFVAIVDQIGVKNAVPKKILEMMNDPTLTRENVASHLQKYRLFLRKSDESKQQKRQMQTQAINRQMQTQAINRQFNPQAYSYNNQNQVNLNVNKFQHLVQKQINVFGYISPPNQFSPESYSIPEPSFGLQTNNGISSTTTFLNKISSFGVGEICDFETINDSLPPLRRSIKLRKLSHDVSNENLSDAFLHSSTTLIPCTINNVSTRLSSTFGENNLCLRNSGNYPDNESIPPKNSR